MLNEDSLEDEVSSDTQSTTSSRRTSLINSHMASTTTRLRRTSVIGRPSSIIDTNDNKQPKQQTPVKVLIVNGKCSEVFKSTLEDCVEECILEFTGESSIYVPKAGQSIQIPVGSKQSSVQSMKEPNSNVNPSTRFYRRRSSVNQFNLPQIAGIRTSQANNFSSSQTSPMTTSTSRMRYPLVQQKFSLAEDISEESTECETTGASMQNQIINDSKNEHAQPTQVETLVRQWSFDASSQSVPTPNRKLTSCKTQTKKPSRQKDYRLSDLVMYGPEHFAHVFNLPRTSKYALHTSSKQQHSNVRQQNDKSNESTSELDRIKQDLFHRYLWTQKPQVSCRIRPISMYNRSTTFVT